MRTNVDDILRRATTTRNFANTSSTTHVQLDVEELINTCQQRASEESNEELEEGINSEEIINAMNTHFVPSDLTESVESVALPQEEEADYSNIIAHDETARFSSAEWFAIPQSMNILLAGIGGIGSWLTLLLSRLRPAYIDIYDPDRVELVNLAGQMYGVEDIGSYKTDAVIKYVRTNANYYNLFGHSEPFSGHSSANIMMCGFDNMAARRLFFRAWKSRATVTPMESRERLLFIDGRLTATEFQIFCITGNDDSYMERYEKEFLFSDEVASQEVCSFKQTAYLANMIAGTMTNLFINFCANLCGSPFKKALPFLTKYNTDMMMFNIEY